VQSLCHALQGRDAVEGSAIAALHALKSWSTDQNLPVRVFQWIDFAGQINANRLND